MQSTSQVASSTSRTTIPASLGDRQSDRGTRQQGYSCLSWSATLSLQTKEGRAKMTALRLLRRNYRPVEIQISTDQCLFLSSLCSLLLPKCAVSQVPGIPATVFMRRVTAAVCLLSQINRWPLFLFEKPRPPPTPTSPHRHVALLSLSPAKHRIAVLEDQQLQPGTEH